MDAANDAKRDGPEAVKEPRPTSAGSAGARANPVSPDDDGLARPAQQAVCEDVTIDRLRWIAPSPHDPGSDRCALPRASTIRRRGARVRPCGWPNMPRLGVRMNLRGAPRHPSPRMRSRTTARTTRQAPHSAGARLSAVLGVARPRSRPEPRQDQQQRSHDEGGEPVRRVMVGRSRLLPGEEARQRTRRFDPVDDRHQRLVQDQRQS